MTTPRLLGYAMAVVTVCGGACGGGENPAEPSQAEYGISATGMLALSSISGGVLEAELLLDGVVVDRRTFQPATPSPVFLQVSDRFISRGQHRLALRLVRHATTPSTYYVQLGVVVLHLPTNTAQQITLAEAPVEMPLSEGQSVIVDFAAGS